MNWSNDELNIVKLLNETIVIFKKDNLITRDKGL